jgi:hypothetical protein
VVPFLTELPTEGFEEIAFEMCGKLMNSLFVIVGRNTNLLRSAKKYGKNVKAIAVTGSINAITMGDVEDRKRRAMSNTEWLPVSQLRPPYHSQAPHTDTAMPAHPR